MFLDMSHTTNPSSTHIVQADCPTAAKRPVGGPGAGCFNCGGPHLAKQCPQPPTGASRARIAGVAPGGIRCHACGGPNHIAKDCRAAGPAAGPLAGRFAGPGAGAGPRPPKKCYRCNQIGHIARDCTAEVQANGSAGAATSPSAAAAPAATEATTAAA